MKNKKIVVFDDSEFEHLDNIERKPTKKELEELKREIKKVNEEMKIENEKWIKYREILAKKTK